MWLLWQLWLRLRNVVVSGFGVFTEDKVSLSVDSKNCPSPPHCLLYGIRLGDMSSSALTAFEMVDAKER